MTMREPSALTATLETSSVWPASSNNDLPVRASTTSALLPQAKMRRASSGVMVTLFAGPASHLTRSCSLPVLASQTRTDWSSEPVATSAPFLLKTALRKRLPISGEQQPLPVGEKALVE